MDTEAAIGTLAAFEGAVEELGALTHSRHAPSGPCTSIRSCRGWGYNGNGQLGDGTTTNRLNPTRIGNATTWKTASAGAFHTLALRTDGTLWSWGFNLGGALGDGTTTSHSAPVQVGTAAWKSVSAGYGFSVGIRTNGTLWGWGTNPNGQLGDGTQTEHDTPTQDGGSTNWVAVSAGGSFAEALRTR